MIKRVCVVTGSRADYSHLSPVIDAIKLHPKLTLQLIVTGQHLDKKYGSTWVNIKNDGHKIDQKIDIGLKSDTPLDTANSLGRGVGGIAKSLNKLDPDILVALGDRFEIFAAAMSALLLNIPIAHIHGGEETEAAFDDAIRHAVTKISHLHFCSAKLYADRIRQMGEDPKRIHMVGAPGLDQLKTIDYLDAYELSKKLKIKLRKSIFVITYHPVTLKPNETESSINALISALNNFKDTTLIFTGVNSDPGNRLINNTIEEFVSKKPTDRILINSMDKEKYLSVMKLSDVVIGNSSAGMIEAPALGIPTVNIGDRQKGRITNTSIINCLTEKNSILDAINKAMSAEFLRSVKKSINLLRNNSASEKIAVVIANTNLKELSIKSFHDLEWLKDD